MLLSSLLFRKGSVPKPPPPPPICRNTMLSLSQPSTTISTINLGLKNLADHRYPNDNLSSSCVTRKLLSSPSFYSLSPSSSSSSFSSSSSSMGSDLDASTEAIDNRDCDGGDDNDEEEEEEEDDNACWGYYGPRDEARRFPPPIPMLAKLENSSSCHMPRILKRTYEDGGRLVIRQLKVHHHEFFRSHRENGRLMLKLIHVDDEDLHCDDAVRWDGIQEEEEDDVEDEGDDVEEENAREEKEEEEAEELQASASPSPLLFEDVNVDNESTVKERAPQTRPWAPAMLSLEMLSSSMPETTGSVGNGCFLNGKSMPLFKMPTPMVHLVQS